MRELHIDLETRSGADLNRCGVYRYSEDPEFSVLLFGYSADGSPVRVIDLANGERIPPEIVYALTDPGVLKWAHNASFERVCLSKYLGLPSGEYLDPSRWRCSMMWASYLTLPPSLKDCGTVLKFDAKKMTEGANLIKKFCIPDKSGSYASCSGDDWNTFIRYNARDVEVEMQIINSLSPFPVPDRVWTEYAENERINDRGVRTDINLAEKAVEIDRATKDRLTSSLKDITGLENPNSVQQLKGWLSGRGIVTDTLGKKTVSDLLPDAEATARSVLELRQQASKSSVKKYEAMLNSVCSDGRIHGVFRFYGASRTGRFSSKLVQLQNLPQNHLADLADARVLVSSGNPEAVEMLYGDIPDTLSQLIRTAFIPPAGKKFIVADFSAIEARVIAWFAGETWRLDTFRNGGDIYCASASKMFGVPVEKHGQNGHLRQKGKVAELACGYGGGVGAMKAFGADRMGLDDASLQKIVSDWRDASPNITKFWWDVDAAAKKCIKNRCGCSVRGLTFSYERGFMFITLPSGRRLAYAKPRISENRFGGEGIEYQGVAQNRKWQYIDTYGPKLVENIVQGTARDILCYAIHNLSAAGYPIVMHIHDECVIEADMDSSIETVCRIMGKTPLWAEGLPLRADGYECEFYMKD